MLPCLAQKPDLINGFEFFMNHGAPCFTNMTKVFGGGIGRNRTMKDVIRLLMECRIILLVA